MVWMNAISQGIFLGGLYGLFAVGLSLVFGVMRIVNIAHGDFIVLAAFMAFAIAELLGLGPAMGLAVALPVMMILGYALQRGLLNRTLGDDPLPPLLVTFGLSIVLQNLLLEVFSADSRKIDAGWFGDASVTVAPGLSWGYLPIVTLVTAVAGVWALHTLFWHTRLGRVFRATSDDLQIARYMGVKTSHVFALATAIAFFFMAVAGVLLALRTNFDPSTGPLRLIFAFEAVIIGGLGNIWGTLIGGLLLGVAQAVGAQIDASFQILAGHVVFLLVLVFRPQGLVPKVA